MLDRHRCRLCLRRGRLRFALAFGRHGLFRQYRLARHSGKNPQDRQRNHSPHRCLHHPLAPLCRIFLPFMIIHVPIGFKKRVCLIGSVVSPILLDDDHSQSREQPTRRRETAMMMTGVHYVASIKKMRPNIYKWGKLIEDVTTHPATRLHVQSVKRSYDLSFDPEKASVYTGKSPLTGETVHRWNSLMQSAEDVMGNSNMKREQYHQSGTCQGATCAGWTAMNVLWDITFQMDKDLGTNYHERVKKFWKYMEAGGVAMSGAITDAKGNPSSGPRSRKTRTATFTSRRSGPTAS